MDESILCIGRFDPMNPHPIHPRVPYAPAHDVEDGDEGDRHGVAQEGQGALVMDCTYIHDRVVDDMGKFVRQPPYNPTPTPSNK